MNPISPIPKFRAFTPEGLPLVGGKLFTYEAGTTTPQVTYSDSSLVSENTNPVILDANGEAEVRLHPEKVYKFILTDADDNELWSEDDVAVIFPASISATHLKPGFLSNDTIGHALMEDGYLSANTEGRAKMAAKFVTTDKLNDASVTTEKINNESVTLGKLAPDVNSLINAALTKFLARLEFADVGSDEFNVPSNVYNMVVEGCGGGGGGGAGAAWSGTGSCGGGGGAGSQPITCTLKVNPGETVLFSNGSGGSGGASAGANGNIGAPTTISGSFGLVVFLGGKGGKGGILGGTAKAAGGDAIFPAGPGGESGHGSSGVPEIGEDGHTSLRGQGGYSVPPPNATSGTGSSGGGGGGGGFGDGAQSGLPGNQNTSSAASDGANALPGSGGGGGGGGGACSANAAAAGKGGSGGSGRLIILY